MERIRPFLPGSGQVTEDGQQNFFGCVDNRTLSTRIWQGTAAGSLALNLAAMVIEGGVTIASGIVAALIAPVVIFLQFRLSEMDTLRTVQNQLRDEVNRLHLENNKMGLEIRRLDSQVGSLQAEEDKFNALAKKQGKNADSLVRLVKENKETIDGLKEAVRADLTQTILSAVIESDYDSSGTFSDQEIKILELRMRNVPGVKVNHHLLVQTIHNSDRKLSSALDLVKHLDRGDLADDHRIFQFDEDHLDKQYS